MPDYIPTLTGGLVPPNSLGQGPSVISSGQPNLAAPPPAVDNSLPKTTDGITVTATALGGQIELQDSPQSTSLIPQAVIAPTDMGANNPTPLNAMVSYAGTNIQALIEIADNPAGTGRYAKQIVELTTVSISIHRAKSPARALGFIGAKGYARGGRTIAGTMVFTQFTQDVLREFLASNILTDLSKDTTYVKVDQLPLFNITLLYTSEYGYMSYRRLYGVDFVTDGTIYSTNDMMTEQTISYVASDMTPLMPLGQNATFASILGNPATSPEKTPGSVISAQNQVASSQSITGS
jgi:hypothetical protein